MLVNDVAMIMQRARQSGRTNFMNERKPRGGVWVYSRTTTAGSHWHHKRRRLHVISAMVDTELPGSGGQFGPTWHVSVSRNGSRCSDGDLEFMRVAFGMSEDDAEEDNHQPGVARHLFMPVDLQWRNQCDCKVDEIQVVEPDGYVWSNTHEGCRGCEFQALTGKICTLHGGTE